MNARAGAALAGLVAMLVLAACSGITGVRSQQGHTALADTQWVLQTLNGEAVLAGTSITAQFSESEIAGSSGCNSYSGSYAVDSSAIQIEGVGMTAMACMEPEGGMDQEQAFVEALVALASHRLAGDRLELLDGSGGAVLHSQTVEASTEYGAVSLPGWCDSHGTRTSPPPCALAASGTHSPQSGLQQAHCLSR